MINDATRLNVEDGQQDFQVSLFNPTIFFSDKMIDNTLTNLRCKATLNFFFQSPLILLYNGIVAHISVHIHIIYM